MELDEYRSKRDFEKTPEPAGIEHRDARDALVFVVHKHHASRLHWDLRLELDGVLKSWAVPKGPSLDPNDKKLAVMVEDHPFDYRTFEGVIPEGSYGAGPVMIWDRGTYHAVGSDDRSASEAALRKGLAKGHLSFILQGQRLQGEFALVRMRKGEENNWLLLKKRDAFVGPGDVAALDTSVATGRTMQQIREAGVEGRPSEAASKPGLSRIDLSGAKRAPLPGRVKPMQATLVDAPFDRQGWLFEIKWDGYRALAEIRNGDAVLYSRRDQEFNDRFPTIARALRALPFEALFDGEIVVVDESGRADFQMLQDYSQGAGGALVYYLFDILYFNGYDLTRLPLSRRKAILRDVVPEVPNVRLSDHVEQDGISLFEAAKANMVEGIVAKDGNSPYRPGQRTREWLKIKTHRQQEAIIGGYTAPRGGRKGFGALVLGVYEAGGARQQKGQHLVYIGHTGGGFTERQISSLTERLGPIATGDSPFAIPPKTNTRVTWVEPMLVCEVRFSEWTKEGLMRHPVFLGLREDLDPREVKREISAPLPQPAPGPVTDRTGPPSEARRGSPSVHSGRLALLNDEKVQITNPDKVFWPEEGYTKADLIDYYREVAPYILRYLEDRPQSLHRHPDGIDGDSFFQKNVDHNTPGWIRTVPVRSESEQKETVYMLCQDLAALVYMANLGCIEINPWHSRIGRLDTPDYMVLDLDPLDVPFGEVVRTAVVTRDVLEEVGARAFCKTSGATGLHIYVPLGAAYTHEQSTQFARLVNALVHAHLPRTTSIERSPEKRRNRVYLDYLQNGRGQTLAAPYCVRPRKGAPVSTPLAWAELNAKLDPMDFTMKTMLARLKDVGDLWKGVLESGIDMEACLERLESISHK